VKRFGSSIVALAIVAFVSACSGGTGTQTPSSPSHDGTHGSGRGTVTFTLSIPHASSTSRTRTRQDASFAMQSLSIVLASENGTAATGQTPTIVNTLPNTGDCQATPSTGDYFSCSVAINAPSGNDVFTAAAFAGRDGTGAQLSTGSATATVPANGSATVPLTLDGIVAGITVGVAAAVVPVGLKSTFYVYVSATDAAGETIIGSDPFSTPVTLSVSDPANVTTLSQTTVTSPAAGIPGTYDGRSLTSPPPAVTIGASAANVPASAITSATLVPDDERGWLNGATYDYLYAATTQVVPSSGTPAPASTTSGSITATISTNGSFNGQTGLIDRHEVDNFGSPPSTTTYDYYYQYLLAGPSAQIGLAGYNETTPLGSTFNVMYSNQIFDELPEVPNGTWSNLGQYSSNYQAASGDVNPTQSYQTSDGSYEYNDTFANGTTSAATVNTDGSGTYTFTYPDFSSHVFTIGTPQLVGGVSVIPIAEQINPASGPSTMSSANVPNWYPGGSFPQPALSDTTVDHGPATVPASCGVAAQFAGSANQIVETYSIVDPVVGDIYTYTKTSYVENRIGTVCNLLTSSEKVYYAIGNAANENDGISEIFFGFLLYTTNTSSNSGLQSYGA
jgi:hypothetical protein